MYDTENTIHKIEIYHGVMEKLYAWGRVAIHESTGMIRGSVTLNSGLERNVLGKYESSDIVNLFTYTTDRVDQEYRVSSHTDTYRGTNRKSTLDFPTLVELAEQNKLPIPSSSGGFLPAQIILSQPEELRN